MADDNNAAPSGTPDTSAAPQADNLLDALAPAKQATDGKSAAAEVAAPAADPAKAPTAEQKLVEWYLADGVKGADKPPDWFKADKYKSVADQAKAYTDLEKKHGELAGKLKGFVGAPEAYELTMPTDLAEMVEWRTDDPLMTEFQSMAKEAGMSQQTFEKCLHMLAKYEYTNMAPDWAKEKQAIGDRADERLTGFEQWYKANLDEEGVDTIRRALGINPTPSAVFKALETVAQLNRQPAGLQTPDETVAPSLTLADVDRMQADPRFATDATYRAEVRAKRAQVVGTGDHKVIVGGARKAS
jgi:hypothetical protein